MGKFIRKIGKNFVIDTPVGDLEWVTIEGQGKLNTLNDKYYYQCTLLLPEDSPECKELIAEIAEFWAETAPKKFAKKEPSSTGYKVNMVATGEVDEDDEPIKVPDGRIAFYFKTETTYKDGKPKVIQTFNARGTKVALGDRKIGNGSRGRVNGIIVTYEQPKDAGTSLYLNAIQLSKFVEFTGGPNFEEIEEEDAFEGFEDGMSSIPEENQKTATATPRL